MRVKKSKATQRQRMVLAFGVVLLIMTGLTARLVYVMMIQGNHYYTGAQDVHSRQRKIKAPRGKIYDRKHRQLASNQSVSTISVIHSQLKDPETVIRELSSRLDLEETEVRKKVEKISSMEKIKTNVDKKISDEIRELTLDGVKIDEDDKRYYPYDTLASKVIGFTGADNQGILGLEVTYDDVLRGKDGYILTYTTATGLEVETRGKDRQEPQAGQNLYTSLDVTIQKYAAQAAKKVMKEKKASRVSVVVMNPQNGEIYAMANAPEYSLQHPFDPVGISRAKWKKMSAQQKQEYRNKMWRNFCVSDTYEPGSTFKIITACAALEAGVVTEQDPFYCPGFKIVEDRRIRCHKTKGHGSETFAQGFANSCNPVFMEVGARVGVPRFFEYLRQFEIMKHTGIDVPGEAGTIMHEQKRVGNVELATMSFGQSFQISPVRLMSTISSLINGGISVTPHFGVAVESSDGSSVTKIRYPEGKRVVSEKTSKTIRGLLGKVVEEGSGSKAAVEGYQVGAKTGTSEKLPRRNEKYIASTLAFAPVDDPKVAVLVLIDEPKGMYYGGVIAAPVASDILDDILPYLGIARQKAKAAG